MSSREDSNVRKNPTTSQTLPQQQQQQQGGASNSQKTRLGILPSENIKEKQVSDAAYKYKNLIS